MRETGAVVQLRHLLRVKLQTGRVQTGAVAEIHEAANLVHRHEARDAVGQSPRRVANVLGKNCAVSRFSAARILQQTEPATTSSRPRLKVNLSS